MSPTTPVQLVCFDLGGVIVRCVDSWAHACAIADVPQLFQETEAEVQRRVIDASKAFEVGRVDVHGFAEVIAADSDYTPEQAVTVISHWLVELYPGAAELLGDLKAAGVRTACLSNTNHLHWDQMLDPAGAYAAIHGLDHLFASHLIRHRKPDQGIYEHVERELGIDPASILFFDDREENVTAATHALWRAERINPRKDTVGQLRKFLGRHGVL